MNGYHQKLKNLLVTDPLRMQLLRAVRQLNLPDCWVAAGFVRNLVWDAQHNIQTELNDVDVIFHQAQDEQDSLAQRAQKALNESEPAIRWQVKNQALMHLKHQHPPYINSADAMKYWPEQQTAVAVRIDAHEDFTVLAPFGLQPLFSNKITYNPKGNKNAFIRRVKQKKWLHIWPNLTIESDFR